SGRINMILRAGIDHVGGYDGIDDVFLDFAAQVVGGDVLTMLRRHNYRVDPQGLAVDVLHADLTLAIGPQKIEDAFAPNFAQLPNQLVSHHDGQRHELGSFVAGISKHEALVAGAAGIHAHRDVGRLALDGVEDAAGMAIETVESVVVADVIDDAARQFRHVDISMRRNLA